MPSPLRLWLLAVLSVFSGCTVFEITVHEGCESGACCEADETGSEVLDVGTDPPLDSTSIKWHFQGENDWYPSVKVTATGLSVVTVPEGTMLEHHWAVYGVVSDSPTVCGTLWYPNTTYLLVEGSDSGTAKTEWVKEIDLDFLTVPPGDWVSLDVVLMPNRGMGGIEETRIYHFCADAPPNAPSAE